MTRGSALLAVWLDAKGLTQSEFAAETGIPQPRLSTYLAGGMPTVKYAVAIAEATSGDVPADAWVEMPSSRELRSSDAALERMRLRARSRTLAGRGVETAD